MADPQHHVTRIGPPARSAPLFELLRQIGWRLARQQRIARACAFSARSVAIGTSGQTALGITVMIQRHRRNCGWRLRRRGQLRVMHGHRSALRIGEPLGNPRHLRMLAATIGIGDHLAFDVARIEPGEARGANSVAQSVKPMTGKASIARSRIRPRQRDQFARSGQSVGGGAVSRSAAAEQDGNSEGGKWVHGASTTPVARLFRIVLAAAMLLPAAACKGEPQERHDMPFADAARGREAAVAAGCGACHSIPGIEWPQGSLGPPLYGFASRTLLGGQLPNRPEVLAAYIRNAPSLVPGSAMPAMPVSAAEARDIAAFLYQSEGR